MGMSLLIYVITDERLIKIIDSRNIQNKEQIFTHLALSTSSSN